jgi:phospholipase C
MQKLAASSLAALLVAGQISGSGVAVAQHSSSGETATPIKHLVVIFQENVSFDHYFGTYPTAMNPQGEPRFVAAPGTPAVNGFTDGLLHNNPNFLNTALNGAGAMNPFRLDRSQAATADQDHNYGPEQQAFDGGLMDGFPKFTGVPGPPPAADNTTGLVMGYYDGNTVTALWNYAQRFTMNDNSFNTTFGPSTPGALNLISGQTGGIDDSINPGSNVVPDGGGGTTLVKRCGSDRRCVCERRAGALQRAEHRRPVEQPRRHLGLLRGRLQFADGQCKRLDGLQPLNNLDHHERKEG